MSQDTTTFVPDEPHEPLLAFHQFIFNEDGLVVGALISNLLQPGAEEVSEEVFNHVFELGGAGRVRRNADGSFSAYDTPPPPLPPGRTYKADIWRRATDEEAEVIDAQLNAQPLKLRNLFRDAQYLDHADEYFIQMKAGFVGAFGQARADELLAASE
jgi:hypothetical protein